MKRTVIFLFALLALAAKAQTGATDRAQAGPADKAQSPDQGQQAAPTLRFGYLSYGNALKAMPEYAEARKNLALLEEKYDAEAQRVEKEFNVKYEEFLEGQRDFPKSILEKRQMELQELMDKNIAFKEESRRLLRQAEEEAMAPIHARLGQLLKLVAEDRRLAFIINTDNHACPYISPGQGENLDGIVKATLAK